MPINFSLNSQIALLTARLAQANASISSLAQVNAQSAQSNARRLAQVNALTILLDQADARSASWKRSLELAIGFIIVMILYFFYLCR